MKSYKQVISEAAASKKSGFVGDIESLTTENSDFRRVLYTAKNCQLVVMTLKVNEEIGQESHPVDQFFRVESGTGKVVINGKAKPIDSGSGLVIPAGSQHNIINTGKTPLKMYTIYSPPQHLDGTVHATRKDAESDTEQFNGKTTE